MNKNTIETFSLQVDVNYPLFLINLLKKEDSRINNSDIQSVINWVNYDIARSLEFSEQWMYAFNSIFNRVNSIIEKTETIKEKKLKLVSNNPKTKKSKSKAKLKVVWKKKKSKKKNKK